MLNRYVDVVVVRHSSVEPVFQMAEVASVPLINGGNGIGRRAEHPSQAIVDAFTIHRHFGYIDGIRVLIVGGLHQRATTSLLYLLNMYSDVTVYAMCPEQYMAQSPLLDPCKFEGLDLRLTESMESVIQDVDVIYVNTMSETRSDMVPDAFKLSRQRLATAKPDAIVLHPLPRGEELPAEIDQDPRARYFSQAENGVSVRMALLETVLSAHAEMTA